MCWCTVYVWFLSIQNDTSVYRYLRSSATSLRRNRKKKSEIRLKRVSEHEVVRLVCGIMSKADLRGAREDAVD